MSTSDKTLSRRQFVSGLGIGATGLGVFSLSGGAAFAQARGNPFRAQAEWTQKYDADARLRVRRVETPLLSQQTIAGTEQAIAQYQQLATNGGWGSVPAGRTLKLGSRSQAVLALRQRLAAAAKA